MGTNWTKQRLDNLMEEDRQFHLKLAEIGNRILESSANFMDWESYYYEPFTEELEWWINDDGKTVHISEGDSGDYYDNARWADFPEECIFSEDFMKIYEDDLKEKQRIEAEKRLEQSRREREREEARQHNLYLQLKEKYEGAE